MSTNATITINNGNKQIRSIYSHWDGNPMELGKTLLENYTNEKVINEIINLGSVSALKSSIQCPEGHDFETPVDGYSIFYNRDRGDELNIVEEEVDILTIEETLKFHCDLEFNYLFNNGKWYVSTENSKFVLLTEKIIKTDIVK